MSEAADLIEQQAASLAEKDKEISDLHGLLDDMESLKNTYRDDCHLAESHVEQAVKVMKLVADAVFVAGLTADNTQAWQAARAFVAQHGSDSREVG